MKLRYSIRVYLSCLMSVALIICLCSGCTYESKEVKKQRTISNVIKNKDQLIDRMEEIERWSEDFYQLFNDEGQIKGVSNRWPYHNEPIINSDICGFFAENSWIDGFSYLENSDIIAFYTDGMGIVPSSLSMGFYYSPQDKPAWIDSEQLKPFGLDTGQYNDYPMIREGKGWIPDKSVLDPEKDSLLKPYGLYTERICECLFYYESWY